MKKQKVNEEIMAELLSQPGIKENVDKMTKKELAMYKRLLISNGIYAQYCKERGQ